MDFKASFDSSQMKIRNYRQARKEFVSEIVGGWYGDQLIQRMDRSPLRLLNVAVNTLARALIARNPRVQITTQFTQLKPLALDAEVVINQRIEEFNLQKYLMRWLKSALTGIGIMQIALEAGDLEEDPDTGEWIPAGRLSVWNISLDDWICDMSARTLDARDCWYTGHYFERPLDQARNDPQYDQAGRLNLVPVRTTDVRNGQSPTKTLGQRNVDKGRDYMGGYQFYFPEESIIRVLPWDFDDNTPPLMEYEWDGPDGGPYQYLFFEEVEDNPLPLPPAATIIELCKIADAIFDKEADNAENAKTVLGYRPGGDDSAKRIVGAANMEAIEMEDPDAVREFRFNGPRSENLGFLANVMGMWNMVSGNVNLIGGYGTSSETATQDNLLFQQQQGQIDVMRDAVYSAVDTVLEHWCFHYWHDPIRADRNVRQVPNTKIFVPVMITPEMRKNTWSRFNFRIEPHSLARRTPMQKVMELDQLVQGIILPAMPILMEQRLMFDMGQYLQTRARLTGTHELLEIVKPMDGQWQNAGPIGDRPHTWTMGATQGMLGQPKRYEHINRTVGGKQPGSLPEFAQSFMAPKPEGGDNAESVA